MLIAQSGINCLSCINAIKHKAHEYYALIYRLGLPTDDMTKEEYFDETAQLFRSRATNSHRIKKDIIDLINSSREDTFLLVTDFENDLHLDDFAKLMRAILDQANGRIKLITMGGEKLANLQTNKGINSYFNYFETIIIDKPCDYTIENHTSLQTTISINGDNSGVTLVGDGNTIHIHKS